MNTGIKEPITGQPPLSISHGAELLASPDELRRLADALNHAASQPADHGILYLHPDGAESFQSYAALLEEAERILSGLRGLGLKPLDPVIFQLDRNDDFIPAFWACQLGGFVPVPLTIPPTYDQSHATLSKLRNAWVMLDKPMILAGEQLVADLKAFGMAHGLEPFRAQSLATLRNGPRDSVWHDNHPDDLALLLLTSGSTGVPKAVMQSHRALLGRSASTAQMNGFTPDDISLNWMPLDHVGGIVMFHLHDLCVGCRQIQASTETVLRQPLQWLDWIDKYRVTLTWAPNFAFGLINDQADEISKCRWDLGCLRFILNGGEAIVSRTARRFIDLLAPFDLPATAMHPSWGMSETCSGVTFSDHFSLATTSDSDMFVEVGGPIPGISIRIVNQSGNLVEEGRIGSLHIQGVSITTGYYHNSALSTEVFSPDGWFITGDLGFLKNGRLTITGREKDVIIINGINFYSHEIEAVVEEVEGVEVSYTAVCAIRKPGEDTDRLGVFFVPTEAAAAKVTELIRTIRSAVVKHDGVTPDFIVPLLKDQIPKTAIGKIQRTILKERFEKGEFDGNSESASTAPATTPDWIFEKVWRAEPLTPSGILPAGDYLLFAEENGLSAAVGAQIEAAGGRCVHVRTGTSFEKFDAATYRIAPNSAADYVRLFDEMLKDGWKPMNIVHLWTYGVSANPESLAQLEADQFLGTYSILHLFAALVPLEERLGSLRIALVSNGVQPTSEEDAVKYSHAPVIGLIKTIPQEVPWMTTQHIDLDIDEAGTNAAFVYAEIKVERGPVEVAYRAGRRLVVGLRKVRHIDVPNEPIPFKTGGVYVMSGGLGGIGSVIARELLTTYQARLIIIGRSELPAPEEWPGVLATTSKIADRVRELHALERLGGEVRYVSAQMNDATVVQTAVDASLRQWDSPLDGVLHLAGVYHESLLRDETVEKFALTLAPKMMGAWVLNQLVKNRPGALFINFSSLISFFGSLSTGAYAAANNFLDSFWHFQRYQQSLRSYSLLWSSWMEIGMSRGYAMEEALRSRGYLRISPERGLDSLLYALQNRTYQILIGLDQSNKIIQGYLDPSEQSGAVHSSAAVHDENYIAPGTETEKQLALIWEELLNVRNVGIKDNFFELGGRSVLAAKMFSRIHKVLGKNLPIPALFKAPTIELLAKTLDAASQSSTCKIITFSATGTLVPVVLIPPAGSDGSAFEPVAKAIAAEHPMHAIQPRSLDGSKLEMNGVSVVESAKLVAAEIRNLHGLKPVTILAAGSAAGLAWETASQLASTGNPVSRLLLIDPAIIDPDYQSEAPGGGMRRFLKSFSGKSNQEKEIRNAKSAFGPYRFPKLSAPLTLLVSPPFAPSSDVPFHGFFCSHTHAAPLVLSLTVPVEFPLEADIANNVASMILTSLAKV